ncbi:MAG TPA: diacylglycerol kinase family protein [Sedimentisphaerales bacterium]|nr:diacylglycerol kinase family protein [Sedimentisphaerales bacterium]HRS11592.1 diacylglycerol kinase family protein [Sedimentisphaerales bacterium]HRV48255.1 diacylglycerol kinase family protein [Sedimentisphaerales bacterium]
MKFGIVANPKSGATSVARKEETLRKASQILGGNTVLAGLDTTSREEFLLCAKDLAEKVDVLIVAGGDGTFSDIINAVRSEVTLSYMPLGSGCALRYALDLPPQVSRVARQIRDGRLHALDLILCDESTKAFMASVGLEADILHRRETLQAGGVRGPHAYAMATFGSFLADLERTDMTISVDDRTFVVPGAVTAIVTKIAYYGYKMKIVPDAVFDDGHLHLLAINSGWGELVQSLATSFLDGNRFGRHEKGRRIRIAVAQPRHAQTDGNLYRQGTTFDFRVLPGALKMWY